MTKGLSKFTYRGIENKDRKKRRRKVKWKEKRKK
jgi:hypothetical protein